MKVPAGTSEYQASIGKARGLLHRLSKGKEMLEESTRNNELLEATKIIRLWERLANELFLELEIATLLHQHMLTGNTVLVRADGSLVKFEDLADPNNITLDPWLLLSLEKLKTVFGDQLSEVITIKEELPS